MIQYKSVGGKQAPQQEGGEILCESGWYAHMPDVQNKWDDNTHTHTHKQTCGDVGSDVHALIKELALRRVQHRSETSNESQHLAEETEIARLRRRFSRVLQQALPFRTRHHLCRQGVVLASTRQPHSRGPASVQAYRTGGVTGSEGQEGANGVGGGIGVGSGNGDGNGDVNGHEDGDGARTGTGVKATQARTVAEMGTGTTITGTGTRIGSGRAEERRKRARNRKLAVDAVRETGETMWKEKKM